MRQTLSLSFVFFYSLVSGFYLNCVECPVLSKANLTITLCIYLGFDIPLIVLGWKHFESPLFGSAIAILSGTPRGGKVDFKNSAVLYSIDVRQYARESLHCINKNHMV